VVLRLGNFPVGGEDVAANAGAEGEAPAPEEAAAQAPAAPDIVTLIVSPQDATSLTYMLYNGAKITLALRGANDSSRIETEAATLQFLLSQYAIPVPAKLPYATEPRVDALEEPFLINGQ
jgi:Flp pilus assembly protein CpaB